MKYNYVLSETLSKKDIDHIVNELDNVDGINGELYFFQLYLSSSVDKIYQINTQNNFNSMRFAKHDGTKLYFEDVDNLDDREVVYEINAESIWSGEELKWRIAYELAKIQDWIEKISKS